MVEGIGLSVALLLFMAAGLVRWWRWQREQEAKAIVSAIRCGDGAELSYLLRAGPRLDCVSTHFGEPALILCIDSLAEAGSCGAGIVELLLCRGAEVNERGTEWKTALMHAASRGSAGMCRLLLQRGADASACDMWGRTAAQMAQDNGHEHLSRLLKQVECPWFPGD
ncbi:MAG: ankyrin repeat domain-containing protein [Acidobacteriota bacterium]|nr:ankyrin repeat domain-containing protein [Acidobacteriota bacterium]